jgi:uncharacterized membrane protein YdfJ with MMPL/SSD domain
MSVTPPAYHARPPWTVRVATWSARHRWPVLALWFVGTIGLFFLSSAMGGTRTQGAVTQNQRAKYEAARAYDLFGTSATTAPVGQSVFLVVSSPTQKVTDPAYAATIAAFVGRLQSLTATVNGTAAPVFDSVTDPLKAPASGLISADATSVRIAGFVSGEGLTLADKLKPVPGLVTELRAQNPGLQIHALNNFLANQEISELVNRDLDGSLRLTIPITFAILLIAFGALVAAFVPLVLAITALLAAFGLLGIYSQIIDPVSPYASQLVVLIGLAVAVDYSLFMISRARREWRRGRTRMEGIATASSTAGRAVFFSGLAVMISIAGLFLLDDPLFRSMAIATIGVVLVSVVGSLTFLPAVLALLGPRLDRGRVPYFGRPRPEGSGLWAAIVGAVMRRPVIAAAGALVVMLALATPVTRLHLGQGDLSAFPDSLDAVQAINLMNAKWPTGTDLTVDIVVTHANDPATQAALAKLDATMLAIPGVSEPIHRNPNADGSVIAVQYTLGGGQNDVRNQDIVQRVRQEVVPALFGPLQANGVQALVSGDAAYTLDVVNFYIGGLPSVFLFVLGLSFVLLLVAFRSVVIPIKAIVLNLLSTAAAYGVMVLVFQEGWFGSTLAVKPGPIEAFVPVIIFTILFGLSMDYHVFIVTRIKEARDRGLPSDQAVARGISITSGTVTSAAAIMVAVFAVFVTLQLYVIKQIGLGLAVAVFLDATVIRSVLLPASMRLLGDWNWWLPGFLRWLPHVTIEGEDDFAPEPAAPAVPGSAGEPAPA